MGLQQGSAGCRGRVVEDGRVVSIRGTFHDITDRKTAELNERESEQKFRTIVDSKHECVKTLDQDGRILEMNPAVVLERSADGLPREIMGIATDITEQKLARDKLRKSEQRFRSIFEQAGIAVGLLESKTGQFLAVNNKYASLLGYSSEEMTEMTWMDVTHPDDTGGDAANMEHVVSGEIRQFTMEKRLSHRDGSVKWIPSLARPMPATR